MPARIGLLLAAAFRAAREAAGDWLSPEEALVRIAEHFISTYGDAIPVRRSRAASILARDGGWCQVPGCSRPAAQAHHVRFRSRGGGDEGGNLASTCPPHHLRGIHMGYIRVHGVAPDGLTWELGVRPGAAPLEVFGP